MIVKAVCSQYTKNPISKTGNEVQKIYIERLSEM